MATLTLTIGQTTSTKTFNNQKGVKIIDDYIAQNEGPVDGSNQEKLDWFLSDMIHNALKSHKERVFAVERENFVKTVNAKIETWD